MSVDTSLLGAAYTAEQSDFARRLRDVMPTGWFPDRGTDATSPTPVLDAVLAGKATAWTAMFTQLQQVFAQTRLATAASGSIDAISNDFFGRVLGRSSGEGDTNYRARIRAALLPARATRAALLSAASTLAPISWTVLEPMRGADTGAIAGADGSGATGGYGSAGLRYGSRSFTYGFLVDGISDSALLPGTRTTRTTQASYVAATGNIVIVGPYVVRVEQGALLAEGRSWNLIPDSLGWSGFDFGAGQSGRAICTLQTSDNALVAGFPLLACGIADGSMEGPAVMLPIGTQAETASVWVCVPADTRCETVSLTCADGTNTATAMADMTQRGTWQRLSASLPAQAAPRTARIQLAIAGSAATSAVVLTQAWQCEPGTIATSYIPTHGQAAMREADVVSTVASPASTSFTAQSVSPTIASVMPVATTCGVRLIQC